MWLFFPTRFDQWRTGPVEVSFTKAAIATMMGIANGNRMSAASRSKVRLLFPYPVLCGAVHARGAGNTCGTTTLGMLVLMTGFSVLFGYVIRYTGSAVVEDHSTMVNNRRKELLIDGASRAI
jgi:hypothetical protein